MAQYYIRTHAPDRARHYLAWVLQHAYPSGVLPEQINPNDGSPLSVAPLVWSHAEFINTVLDFLIDGEEEPTTTDTPAEPPAA
jgi:GH15 family glucan-1,4-alpha-glucosidase